MKLPSRHTGFTIVELLIVMAVISILAVITIVAYNGVQSRAYNARTVQMVSQAVKALEAVKTSNGAYAAADLDTPTACLGSGYPGGTCGSSTFDPSCGIASSPINESIAFNNSLKATIPSGLPAIEHPPLEVSGGWPGCTYTYRQTGPMISLYASIQVNASGEVRGYVPNTSVPARAYDIRYLLRGSNQTCPNGVINTPDLEGWTECSVVEGDTEVVSW